MAVTSTSDPGEFLQSPNGSSDSPAFSLQSTVSLLCCTKTGLMLKDFCIGFELGSFEKPAGGRQELRRNLGHLGHWPQKNIHMKVEGNIKNGTHWLLQPIEFL